MNYAIHYCRLIDNATHRSILPGIYFERHHIIPKCMGGTNDENNIIKLLPEEHYVAHQLLVKIYPGEKKLIYAARLMCRNSQNTLRNNKEYRWLRERFVKSKKGVPRTEEVKEKIRQGNTGKNLSDDTKHKIRNARKNQIITEESNKKRSDTAKSRGFRPPDATGRLHSQLSKTKISESKKGKPSHWLGKSRPQLICEHCGKVGAGGAMFRYHFDNCRNYS